MSRAADSALARHWRDLVERRLPQAARARSDWPVHHDHCFARILLDNACASPWRSGIAPPAWANAPDETLRTALAFGEAVLMGKADLRLLNGRSLAWRGKGAADGRHRTGRQPAKARSLDRPDHFDRSNL